MSDADFGAARDTYRERAKRGAAELCTYYAWGQTRCTVHLAVWLASTSGECELLFDRDADDRQRIKLKPDGMPPLFERTFAHGVDEARAGDAMFFHHMHAMTFCVAKGTPGERWRSLFAGDADGARELALHEPEHSCAEEQVGGFKPVHHHRVAGRKESASEWHELNVTVQVPEEATRSLVSASISATHLEVLVASPTGGTPCLHWRRRLQQRTLKYEDGHSSRTHVDTANSTWVFGTDSRGRRCVQFVLAQWMEGARRNEEEKLSKQLKASGLKPLTEDADPFHLFPLVEAEMWLRAAAVYKPRAALSEAAEKLITEMEGHEEREGRDPAALSRSPLAELWEEGEEGEEGEERGEEREEGDEREDERRRPFLEPFRSRLRPRPLRGLFGRYMCRDEHVKHRARVE